MGERKEKNDWQGFVSGKVTDHFIRFFYTKHHFLSFLPFLNNFFLCPQWPEL